MSKKDTFALLEPIINTIDNSIIINSIVDLTGGKYTLNICNTKWITIGATVTIGANEYKVIDFILNESVTVTGTVLPVLLTFNISIPFKFAGTIIATNEELSNINFTWKKFPMVYLHEIVREKHNNNPELKLDRDSECDLYFLVDSNNPKWLTKDHKKYAINPMRSLLFALIDALNKSKQVGLIDSYDVFDHAKFGVYFADKGHTKKIFNDDLSGTQLRITIPFLKGIDCPC